MDTAGPFPYFTSKRGVVVLVDNYTRYLKIFIVKSKSEIVDAVHDYIKVESTRQ